MGRVLILCPDYIKRQMSGPAIRYFELAHQLHRAGHEVILGTPSQPDLDPQPFRIVTTEPALVRELAPKQDVIVVQGWVLEFFPFLRDSDACLVTDLYCPFYLELLVDREHHPDPDQLTRPIDQLRVTLDPIRQSDFFVCASEKQRDYWMGVLTALNRINPETYELDRSLRSLIDVVPFGLPDEPPQKRKQAMRGVLPGIGPDDYIVLWGSSIYNWFDPLTLIRAVAQASVHVPNLRMVVMATAHPNPQVVTETWMLSEARRLSAELGLTGRHVFFNEGWVPYEDRADWLLEADVGASIHFQHIESHFSFRVRFLDYLWTGLPILCTSGDVLADAVERENLGITVGPGDVDALAQALQQLAEPAVRERYRASLGKYAAGLTWSRAAAPLVRFCDNPRRAPDLQRIAPLKAMPVPLRDYAPANGQVAQDEVAKDWRYYVARAANTLLYDGPVTMARKGTQVVVRRLARGAAGNPAE